MTKMINYKKKLSNDLVQIRNLFDSRPQRYIAAAEEKQAGLRRKNEREMLWIYGLAKD